MNERCHDGLEGCVCLVTGASSGLGVVIAQSLGEAGAKVVLAARRVGRLERAREHLKAQGLKVEALQCDVTQEYQVSNLVDGVIGLYGEVDVLVNNAGATVASPTPEMKLEDWKAVIETNLTGVFLCSKHASRRMIAKRRGKIINMASVYGLRGDVSLELPYYASKAGVIGATKQLALEFAQYNINVNAIAPGFFPSEMTKQFVEDLDALSHTLSRIPLRRIGRPEDLKGIVRFLASNSSDYITGQVIVVDGGWTIW